MRAAAIPFAQNLRLNNLCSYIVITIMNITTHVLSSPSLTIIHVLVVLVFMVDSFIIPCSFFSCSISDLRSGAKM